MRSGYGAISDFESKDYKLAIYYCTIYTDKEIGYKLEREYYR